MINEKPSVNPEEIKLGAFAKKNAPVKKEEIRLGAFAKPKGGAGITVNIGAKGSIADRHNNPGNLMYVGQEGAKKGEPKKGGGYWAYFDDPAEGYKALVEDIKAKQQGKSRTGITGESTIADFFSTYAPQHENDTDTYVATVAKALGVDPATPISDVDARKLAKEVAKYESSSNVTDDIKLGAFAKKEKQEFKPPVFTKSKQETLREKFAQTEIDRFEKYKQDPRLLMGVMSDERDRYKEYLTESAKLDKYEISEEEREEARQIKPYLTEMEKETDERIKELAPRASRGGFSVLGGTEVTNVENKSEADKELTQLRQKKRIIRDTKRYNDFVAEGDKLSGIERAWVGMKDWDTASIVTAGISEALQGRDMAVLANKLMNEGEDALTQDEKDALVLYHIGLYAQETARQDRAFAVGSGLVETVPFIVSMIATSGVGTAVRKGTSKVVQKYTQNEIARKLVSNLSDATFRAFMFPMTYEELSRRVSAQVAYDENMNPVIVGEGEDFVKAMGKSVGVSAIEIFSEGAVGNGLSKVMNKMTTGGRKILQGTKMGDFYRAVARGTKPVRQVAGVHSPFIEFNEEIFAGVTQPIITGEGSPLDFFEYENMLRTAMIVSTMSVMMNAPNAAVGIHKMHKIQQGKKVYDSLNDEAKAIFREMVLTDSFDDAAAFAHAIRLRMGDAEKEKNNDALVLKNNRDLDRLTNYFNAIRKSFMDSEKIEGASYQFGSELFDNSEEFFKEVDRAIKKGSPIPYVNVRNDEAAQALLDEKVNIGVVMDKELNRSYREIRRQVSGIPVALEEAFEKELNKNGIQLEEGQTIHDIVENEALTTPEKLRTAEQKQFVEKVNAALTAFTESNIERLKEENRRIKEKDLQEQIEFNESEQTRLKDQSKIAQEKINELKKKDTLTQEEQEELSDLETIVSENQKKLTEFDASLPLLKAKLERLKIDQGIEYQTPEPVSKSTKDRLDNFMSFKGFSDNVATGIQGLANFFKRFSISKKRFSDLDIETQRRMSSSMLRMIEKPEVRYAIISLVPINVMNNISGGNFSAEKFLDNPSMLRNLLSINSDKLISSGFWDSLIINSTKSGAVIEALDSGRWSIEGIPAESTSDLDLIDQRKAIALLGTEGSTTSGYGTEIGIEGLSAEETRNSLFAHINKNMSKETKNIPEKEKELTENTTESTEKEEEGKKIESQKITEKETGKEEKPQRKPATKPRNKKVTPKNKEDLEKIGREMFGLDEKKAKVFATVADRMIRAQAKRAKMSVEQMYSTYDFVQMTPKQLEKFMASQKAVNQMAKGAFLTKDGRRIIIALTDPNISTPLHELAHAFEAFLTAVEKKTVLKWAKAKEWNDEVSEKFAVGFEKYLQEGKAPSEELKEIFEKFKKWLWDIYNGLTQGTLELNLNDDMRRIYDSMLTGETVEKKPAEKKAEKTKPEEKGPLFQGAERESRTQPEAKSPEGLSKRGEVLFQIVGENANLKQVVRDNLAVAKKMEAAGKSAKEIYLATGWERGADKKWRYEIAGRPILNVVRLIFDLKEDNPFYLKDVIDYPELFEAYPQLKEAVVRRTTDKNALGLHWYDDWSEEHEIELNIGILNGMDNRDQWGILFGNIFRMIRNIRRPKDRKLPLRSPSLYTQLTIAHEIQHAIQRIEGFAYGFAPESFSEWEVEQYAKAFKLNKDKLNEKELRYEIYKRVAGEAEARNVEKRMYMSKGGKKSTSFSESEDVARDEQIVLFQGAERKSEYNLSPKSEVLFQSVWHGSPHEFEKFSTKYMGTGEGNQTYGWGLYFTDREEIARSYASIADTSYLELIDNLDKKTKNKIERNPVYKSIIGEPQIDPITGITIYGRINSSKATSLLKNALDVLVKAKRIESKLIKTNSDRNELEVINDAIVRDFGATVASQKSAKTIQDIREILDAGIFKPANRSLYKVKLHGDRSVDEFNYLRWDNTIDNRTIDVLIKNTSDDKLKDKLRSFKDYYADTKKGIDLYRLLTDHFNRKPKEASLFLLRAGIDGVKYPTEYRSKGTHEESFNYVIFDENIAEIEDKVLFQTTKPVIPETVKVDGKERPTRNSEGNYISNSTDGITNFWKWFGDSKVVENGNPIRVFTGTSKDKDFDKFKAPRNGIWFSPDPKVASQYAEENDSMTYRYEGWTPVRVNTASRVIPVYLKLENPDIIKQYPDEIKWATNYKKALSELFDKSKANGHDGAITPDGSYVVFSPNQIKSATGNLGTFSPESANILFQSAAQEPTIFYSTVEKSLSEIKQAKGTPEQFKAMLLKNGAKQAELDWMGYDEFASDKKSVTKADIQDWINQNKIEIQEVKLGDTYDKERLRAIIDFETFREEAIEDHGERMLGWPEEVQREYNRLASRKEQLSRSTQYDNWQLPGGSNYKEMLLTLPGVYDINPFTGEPSSRPASDKNYMSSHWDEPNILVHIRFKDYTDTKGNKVLFLEEVQSDWAQEGKRKGFKIRDASDEMKALTKEKEDIEKELDLVFEKMHEMGLPHLPSSTQLAIFGNSPELNPEYSKLDQELYKVRNNRDYDRITARMNEIAQEYKDVADQRKKLLARRAELEYELARQAKLDMIENIERIHPMPFKQTPQWVNLALRRMMRYAAEGGYDGIAWTPGEVQTDRYDLSKQVNTLELRPLKDGTGKIAVYANGSLMQHAVKESLPDVIGKDMAEKAINDGVENTSKTYSGLDLKVGGEGMTSFYDKIIPAQFSKLAKPFNSKVGETTIDAGGPIDVQFVPVTQEMKSSVLQGVPLFQTTPSSNLSAYFSEQADDELNRKQNNILKRYQGLLTDALKYVRGTVSKEPENAKFIQYKGAIYTVTESRIGKVKGNVVRLIEEKNGRAKAVSVKDKRLKENVVDASMDKAQIISREEALSRLENYLTDYFKNEATIAITKKVGQARPAKRKKTPIDQKPIGSITELIERIKIERNAVRDFQETIGIIRSLMNMSAAKEFIRHGQYRSVLRRLESVRTDMDRKAAIEYTLEIIEGAEYRQQHKAAEKFVRSLKDNLDKIGIEIEGQPNNLRHIVESILEMNLDNLTFEDLQLFNSIAAEIDIKSRNPRMWPFARMESISRRALEEEDDTERPIVTVQDMLDAIKEYKKKYNSETLIDRKTIMAAQRALGNLRRKAAIMIEQKALNTEGKEEAGTDISSEMTAITEAVGMLVEGEYTNSELQEMIETERKNYLEMVQKKLTDNNSKLKEMAAKLRPESQRKALTLLTVRRKDLDKLTLVEVEAYDRFLDNLINGYLNPAAAQLEMTIDKNRLKENITDGFFANVLVSPVFRKWSEKNYQGRESRVPFSRKMYNIQQLLQKQIWGRQAHRIDTWLGNFDKDHAIGSVYHFVGRGVSMESLTTKKYDQMMAEADDILREYYASTITPGTRTVRMTKAKEKEYLRMRTWIGMVLAERSYQATDIYLDDKIDRNNASIMHNNYVGTEIEDKQAKTKINTATLAEKADNNKKRYMDNKQRYNDLMEFLRENGATKEVDGIEIMDTFKAEQLLRQNDAVNRYIQTIENVLDDMKGMAQWSTFANGRSFSELNDYYPFVVIQEKKVLDTDRLRDAMTLQRKPAKMQASATYERSGATNYLQVDPMAVMTKYIEEIARNYHVYGEMRKAMAAISESGREADKGTSPDMLIGNLTRAILADIKLRIDMHYGLNSFSTSEVSNAFRRFGKAVKIGLLAKITRPVAEMPSNVSRAVWSLFSLPLTDIRETSKHNEVYSSLIEDFIGEKYMSRFGEEVRGKAMKGKLSQKMEEYARLIVTFSDTTVGRPLFIIEFRKNFKKLTGKDFDAAEYAANINYLVENNEAIEKSATRAVRKVEELFNDKAPMTAPAFIRFWGGLWTVKRNSFAAEYFGFLMSFSRNEASQFMDSVRRMRFSPYEEDKKQAARDMTAIIFSNAMYGVLRTASLIGLEVLMQNAYNLLSGDDKNDPWLKERKEKLATFAFYKKKVAAATGELALGGSAPLTLYTYKTLMFVLDRIKIKDKGFNKAKQEIKDFMASELYVKHIPEDFKSRTSSTVSAALPLPSAITEEMFKLVDDVTSSANTIDVLFPALDLIDSKLDNTQTMQSLVAAVLRTMTLTSPNPITPTVQYLLEKERRRYNNELKRKYGKGASVSDIQQMWDDVYGGDTVLDSAIEDAESVSNALGLD